MQQRRLGPVTVPTGGMEMQTRCSESELTRSNDIVKVLCACRHRQSHSNEPLFGHVWNNDGVKRHHADSEVVCRLSPNHHHHHHHEIHLSSFALHPNTDRCTSNCGSDLMQTQSMALGGTKGLPVGLAIDGEWMPGDMVLCPARLMTSSPRDDEGSNE